MSFYDISVAMPNTDVNEITGSPVGIIKCLPKCKYRVCYDAYFGEKYHFVYKAHGNMCTHLKIDYHMMLNSCSLKV